MDNDDFDPRGCQVIIALTVCFWIAMGGLLCGYVS
jgi:hypothetical protein